MKIIFLDIDGVLNSELFYKEKSQDKKCKGESKLQFYGEMIDKRCIELLNSIIKDTDAQVVISSTWRKGRDISWLQSIFEARGFKYKILDKTPVLYFHPDCKTNISVPRGVEIYQWIKNNPKVSRYVIIDDDSDMMYWQRENFFRVDGYCGLTPNLSYRISRYLNEQSHSL